MQQLGVHIVACQETPASTTPQLLDGYVVVGIGETNKLGCALLLNVRKPYGETHKGKHTFRAGDVRVLHADPRLLITRIRIFGQDEVIYVAHAPNIGHDTLDYAQWWEQLQRFCQQWPPSLILGDLNAKLGSLHHPNGVEDSTAGSFHPQYCTPDQDDGPGRLLRGLACDLRLYVETTYHVHEGGHTFVSSSHTQHRID
eukprot:7468489-Pyramimonas_sp.AAC.1